MKKTLIGISLLTTLALSTIGLPPYGKNYTGPLYLHVPGECPCHHWCAPPWPIYYSNVTAQPFCCLYFDPTELLGITRAHMDLHNGNPIQAGTPWEFGHSFTATTWDTADHTGWNQYDTNTISPTHPCTDWGLVSLCGNYNKREVITNTTDWVEIYGQTLNYLRGHNLSPTLCLTVSYTTNNIDKSYFALFLTNANQATATGTWYVAASGTTEASSNLAFIHMPFHLWGPWTNAAGYNGLQQTIIHGNGP